MIRVSTRGRYALRAMVDLAQYIDSGPVGRQDIAERQDISADYVAQLFGDLVEAGLVEGVRGPGGGYRLTRDPAAITARDVVEAVEGPLALVYCVESDEDPGCERVQHCSTRRLWKHLSDEMRDILSSVTLKDLGTRAGQGNLDGEDGI